MKIYHWNEVHTLLSELVSSQTVPGCALSIRFRGEEIYSHAYGYAEIKPTKRIANVERVVRSQPEACREKQA